MTRYAIAGLCVISERPIAGLAEYEEATADECDVVVRWGVVPAFLVGSAKFENGECTKTEVILTVPEVGRYLIRDGNTIVVEQWPSADDREIGIGLAGAAFGILCHQRGVLPLHACAVDIFDGCVAFFGPSRSGKSSLAAAMAMQGYAVLSDDVCYLRRHDQRICAWPGAGQIRLFGDTVQALNFRGTGIRKEPGGRNKYLVSVPQANEPFSPRPLLALFRLVSVEGDQAASVVQTTGSDAIELLIPNVYRLAIATHMGLKPEIFTMCASMVDKVPLYRFMRPAGLSKLPDVVSQTEALLKNII